MPSPTSLTFTGANWQTPQTVTINGLDDQIDDDDVTFSIVTAAAVSSDPAYNGLNAPDVLVTNIDNDTAGIVVTPTSGLTTTEAGGTATFTVRLLSVPRNTVVIGLSSSNTAEGTVSPASLSFSANATALDPRTVTITGVNDFLIDGDVAFTIVTLPVTSSDPKYSGVNPPDVSATNLDNDAAGFIVSPLSGLTTTEFGGSADFHRSLGHNSRVRRHHSAEHFRLDGRNPVALAACLHSGERTVRSNGDRYRRQRRHRRWDD